MEQTHVNEGLGRQELLEILKESKLLSSEELKRAESLDPAGDGAALAEALVNTGMLTSFQMDAVQNRRPEKLKIGNYDLLDKLGTGGTGTVYKARHRRMKKLVALKLLSRSLCKDKTFVQRFQREVETMAQLSHPNIVQATDADEAKVGHFLVMEFVNGHDLASAVQKQGPMSVADAVDCILQSARGLAYVHTQGMIHRDIKPANLLRDASGTVKVTDLGLARISSASTALVSNALTQAGGVLGTVDYMPPEQALDSTNLDHRSDIYSLGATLYYLLTGQPVYPGQTMMDTLLKHRDAPIPSLTAVRGDVPAELDDLFRRMMAKTIAGRVQTMAEVVQGLEAVQAMFGDTATMSPLTVVAPAAPRPKETIAVPQRVVSDRTMAKSAQNATLNAALTVLLVEPSRTQASIIRKYLQSQSIQKIVVATSGQEAIEAVKTECPGAIVSAMYLRDMTGVQLAQRIRTESQAAPGFVLLSSESESADAATLTQSGQALVLQKPFTPEKLIEALSVVSGQALAVLPASTEQMGLSLVKPVVLSPLPAPSPRPNLRVLIVDDSRAARAHMRTVLNGLGLTRLSEVPDGAQAVALLARESFDLIFTDYNMPLMDGRSLVGYLKQNPATADVPVVMVTGETDPAKVEAIRNLGVVAVCDKQFAPDAVRRIVEQLPRG
jgi:serine/threonine protein kinase